ncbi:MAG TPA: response regulator [Bacteroidales bacterium]|jgi:response regulator RpfG family c-di-GMP phosphodiesterase|nr:response regulator [Bacteroidales bacterium]
MNKKISVLYVDDEPINLKLFELNFKDVFNLITASSGFEGLEILKNQPGISVVVSDMRMPKMDGIEFIGKAKAKFPHIVYFILTGFEITDEISQALNSNLINKYFRKPFNFREIESSISSAIG